MINKVRKLFRNEKGQGVVEFAIIVPLLLILICGIIDFGWIYMNQYKVENAAYAGARYASTQGSSVSQEEVKKRARNNLEHGEKANVAVDVSASEIKVTVKYPVKTLTFVAGTIFGSTYTATSTSVIEV